MQVKWTESVLPDLTPGAVYERVAQETVPNIVLRYELMSIAPQYLTMHELTLSGRRRTLYVVVPGCWFGATDADAKEGDGGVYSTAGFCALLPESERYRFHTAICTLAPARATLGYRAATYECAKRWAAKDSSERKVAAARYLVSLPDSALDSVPGTTYVSHPCDLPYIARVLGWDGHE